MVDADTVFRAIAHPARRQMMAMLARSECSVKELTGAFSMSQPGVSQHLRELREAGLVTSVKVGLEQRYSLVGEPIRMVLEWSEQYRRFFDPSGHAWAFVPVEASADGDSGEDEDGG